MLEIPQKHYAQENILLVDKPSGPTSFGVIRFLRKQLDIRKVGHAGTLDPLASGLLVIGIGQGTKKLEQLLKLPKTYEATILFGTSTTSGDIEGEVLKEEHVEVLTEGAVREATASLVGEHATIAPIYSAIKVDGKPLYWYARRGCCPIEMPQRVSRVRGAELRELRCQDGVWKARVFFDVESGTYIRTLVELLGEKLGVPATMCDLRRFSVGEYSVEGALRLGFENDIIEPINSSKTFLPMEINYQTRDMEMTESMKDYFDKRINSLEKLFENPRAFVIAQKEPPAQKNGAGLYHMHLEIRDGAATYAADHAAEDPYIAMDEVKNDLQRVIRKERSTQDSLFKRGARKVKNMLRRGSE